MFEVKYTGDDDYLLRLMNDTKGKKKTGETIPLNSPQYKKLREQDEGNW